MFPSTGDVASDFGYMRNRVESFRVMISVPSFGQAKHTFRLQSMVVFLYFSVNIL